MEPEIKKEHKYLPVLITILVMILVTAGAAVGVWYYMDQHARKAAEDNAKQVEELQGQIDDLKKRDDTTATSTTNTSVDSWKNYTNSKYNFMLTFPESWKGYTVTENRQSDVAVSVRPIISYDFYQTAPLTKEKIYFFGVNVYTPSIWQNIQTNGGSPNNVLLGQNSNYVFSVSRRLDIDSSWGFSEDQSNISVITNTFRLNN